MSAELADPNRVAVFLEPGSNVAIWWGTDPEAPPRAREVRLLLEDVTVLGPGGTSMTSRTVTDADGEQTVDSLPMTLLTLSVDQAESGKIILGSKTGELWFALRSDEADLAPSEAIGLDELFD
ncbi:MAG: RcpC/CpaB family pilus assembly protein [Nocardioidaceae bacterium]